MIKMNNTENIDLIHQEYITKLAALIYERRQIVLDFLKKIEQIKLDQIRSELSKK